MDEFKQEDIAKATLTYINSGLSCVPTGKDKIPRIQEWTSRRFKIPSKETVTKEFSNSGTCVALVTGKVSGNLEILDFDFFGEFFDPWQELVEKESPGLIERLVKQKTQHDGFTIAYRCPEIEIPGNTKLASECIEVSHQREHEFKGKTIKAIKRNGKFYITPCFIETRGEGGYFLAYPSPGYKIEQNRFSQVPNISKEEREILIESAKALNKFMPEHTVPVKAVKDRSSNELTPGDDFDERGNVESILQNHGWVNTGRTATLNGDPGEHWRRPGKERGQSATLINGKRLYVFSTNGSPFEADRIYSPFAIYTTLEHAGDFSEAAKELSRQSYGSKPEKELQTIVKSVSQYSPELSLKNRVDISNVYDSVRMIGEYKEYIKNLKQNRFITGINEIDKRIRGVAGGEVLTFIARSGSFKTAMLQNLLKNYIQNSAWAAGFFSIEMPVASLTERYLEILDGSTGKEVETLFRDKSQADIRQAAIEQFVKDLERLFIVPTRVSLSDIAAYVQLIEREKNIKIGVIGIDYMGLMDGPGISEYEIISRLSTGLKSTAKLLNIPVIVLAQVNRKGGGGTNEISLDMGRGSGAIEEAADFVLGLWQAENDTGEKDLICKILKNRKGPVGSRWKLDLIPQTLQIGANAEEYESPKNAKGGF